MFYLAQSLTRPTSLYLSHALEEGGQRRSGVREMKLSVPRVLSDAEELCVCAVCLSDDGADEGNAIIMCDTCGILAVHQARPKYLPTASLRAYGCLHHDRS